MLGNIYSHYQLPMCCGLCVGHTWIILDVMRWFTWTLCSPLWGYALPFLVSVLNK